MDEMKGGYVSSWELAALVATGVGHVAVEIATTGMAGAAETLGRAAHYYNMIAGVVWGLYMLWRGFHTKGAVAAWGLQRAEFAGALKWACAFGVPGLGVLAGWGAVAGRFPPPSTFWLLIAAYPVWGIAQQFALQGLVTRNLRPFVPLRAARAVTAAALFSGAHFPEYHLMLLTFPLGVAFAWIFERYRNVWALGIVHGLLGAAAYYFVLGQDPGAELLRMLGR